MRCRKCDILIDEKDNVFCQDCYGKENIKVNRNFKRKCFKKYGTRCNRCGLSKGESIVLKNKLTLHHIDEEGDRYDVNNIEILCEECHNEHHHMIRQRDGI